MNKRTRDLLCRAVVLLAGLACFPTHAAEQRRYTVIGRPSCDDWISARRKAAIGPGPEAWAELTSKFWVLGYLSARNKLFVGKQDLLREIDSDTIFDWIDQSCAKKPSDDLVDATDKLFLELQKISK